MSELCSTSEMIERIRNICQRHLSRNVTIGDVAAVLRISHDNLATRKYRDSPPLREIILFCDRYKLDVMKIVIKKSC